MPNGFAPPTVLAPQPVQATGPSGFQLLLAGPGGAPGFLQQGVGIFQSFQANKAAAKAEAKAAEREFSLEQARIAAGVNLPPAPGGFLQAIPLPQGLPIPLFLGGAALLVFMLMMRRRGGK